MVRILGGPLRLHKRAANNIFSGWISLNRYEPPAIIEKKLHNFFEMNEPLGGNKSEWNHLASTWQRWALDWT